MTSPLHLYTQARVYQKNTYIHFLPARNNNLTLNPDKTTRTMFTSDPAEQYKA